MEGKNRIIPVKFISTNNLGGHHMKRFTTILCLLCAFVIILCAQNKAEADSAELQFSVNRFLSENEFSITTPNNGDLYDTRRTMRGYLSVG